MSAIFYYAHSIPAKRINERINPYIKQEENKGTKLLVNIIELFEEKIGKSKKRKPFEK